MPVAGLPAAVEGTIEVLLMKNQVSSGTVSSEGSKTVVVLRQTALTSMAEHSHGAAVQTETAESTKQRQEKSRKTQQTF